ncbi:L-threonylcarbamoyladenylate synthase [Castellaniella caeni]|uniref:L-threonylcarbamoyladenylate synthase n=1 Tax=Castellaniella caeni TaxID=266123 RepID=UPI000832D723|nr:L-threonylcarbamoyladenylate synthase [Castellaniella caeni]
MPRLDQGLIIEAAHRLAQGRLVAFPTETVYGLGADAENPRAVAQIYAAKKRPANHPVIVHLAPDTDPAYWAATVPHQARQLMAAFWPGPLTLILPRAAHIPAAVSGGQDSIGLRCPSHPVAQSLLHVFAALKPHGCGGVAAPSANQFGHVSPTRAEHVRAEFPDLDTQSLMILEGGESQVGIESTILDLSRLDQGMGPALLRPGRITVLQLAEVLGSLPAQPDAAAPRVSGSLKAHYAPHTPVALLSGDVAQLLSQAQDAVLACEARQDGRHAAPVRLAVVVLDAAPGPAPRGVDWIVLPANPATYARRLYAVLRELDAAAYDRILLQRPPQGPEWQGVNDRISRAAAAFTI